MNISIQVPIKMTGAINFHKKRKKEKKKKSSHEESNCFYLNIFIICILFTCLCMAVTSKDRQIMKSVAKYEERVHSYSNCLICLCDDIISCN